MSLCCSNNSANFYIFTLDDDQALLDISMASCRAGESHRIALCVILLGVVRYWLNLNVDMVSSVDIKLNVG